MKAERLTFGRAFGFASARFRTGAEEPRPTD
jgi:hypothetical protein